MTEKRVLIVEDNELNLKLFKDLLEAHGYRVAFTRDGKQAVELARNFEPHTILMDIQLHGISGFDVILEIKQDAIMKHIPIVAVTAFAMKDDEERILQSGCDAYVAKPISIVPFLEVVSRFVNQKLQGQK